MAEDMIQEENSTKKHFHNPAQELESRGVTIFSGRYFNSISGANCSANKFTEYWNDLEPDQFMNDKGLYRRRRFGRYQYHRESSSLSVIEGDHDFYQSEDINQLNGGKCRKFAPVHNDFAADLFLTNVINRCLAIISVKKPEYDSLTINTHLIRIICGADIVGLPTPEGIHRDGHCFVSQHLIGRKNVYGGVSGIYDSNNEPVLHYQLSHFMDTILIDDSIVKHDVSPVFSADKINEGSRDMLIIDYNFS